MELENERNEENEIGTRYREYCGNLTRFINGGCLSRFDRLLSLVLPGLPYRRNADCILREKGRLESCDFTETLQTVSVAVKPYTGRNRHVIRMAEYLDTYLKDDLLVAFVAGSLGTGEEIRYSDFDGFVILKDVVFQSRRRLIATARLLNKALHIMLDFDPLQHHGWFVLAESELRRFPDFYFPVSLLEYSRSIPGNKGFVQVVQVYRSDKEFRRSFRELSDGFSSSLRAIREPLDMYGLKSVLSQFMLLPSFYIQARTGVPIFKKFSFDEARKEFSATEWSIMEEVSKIREEWGYEVTPWKRRVMTNPDPFMRRGSRRLSPKVPRKIRERLNPSFFNRMENLSCRMRERICKPDASRTCSRENNYG